MADKESPVSLHGGPFAGIYPAAELEPYKARYGYRMPVDQHFIVTKNNPFAYAIYEPMGNSSDDACLLFFRRFQKVEDGPFMVEFVGGPLAGIRPMFQPVLGLPSIVTMPVTGEPAKHEDGRERVFAIYKNGAYLGGEHKLIFESEHRDVVKTQRIIFELIGGPFDGVTYDSDAGMLDQQSAFRAGALYFVTDKGQIGKQFLQVADHSTTMIEEFGHEIVQKIGGFPAHKYEIFERLEEPYEVYVRAKYIGIVKDGD